MTRQELTKADARKRARTYATPIDDLIDPSDVCATADTWDEVPDEALRSELDTSVEIIMSEMQHSHHRIRDTVYQLAICLWRDSMPRVNPDHMSDDISCRDMLTQHGYWPTDMTKWEARDILMDYSPTNRHIPYDVWEESVMVVEHGLRQGMAPETGESDK